MSWDQAEDYLYAKLEQSQFLDAERGREQGLGQFLDEKRIKPGLQSLRAAGTVLRWSRGSATSSAGSTACCAAASGAAVEPIGLTLPAYTALSVLRVKDGLSNAHLARLSLVTPQSMSEVLAQLVDKGYVRRRAEPGHGRVIRIELTRAGQPRARARRPGGGRGRAGDARRPRRRRGGRAPRRPPALRARTRARPFAPHRTVRPVHVRRTAGGASALRPQPASLRSPSASASQTGGCSSCTCTSPSSD